MIGYESFEEQYRQPNGQLEMNDAQHSSPLVKRNRVLHIMVKHPYLLNSSSKLKDSISP